jgi:leucyl aminopeptidase (aminopeptidase T)
MEISTTSSEHNGLTEAARIAIEKLLEVRGGERVLIVTNPVERVHSISSALYRAAERVGAEPVLMVQPVKTQLDFADEAVIRAISTNPDVFISISEGKLGKDRFATAAPYKIHGLEYNHVFRYLLGSRRLRAFWSPKITPEIFARTIPIDYERLGREAKRMQGMLDEAVTVHITAPGGTDISIGLRGRSAFVDDGELSRTGSGGNLPAGEVFISPEIGTAEGRIVFDGSISLHDRDVIPDEPVSVQVEEGYVSGVEGGEAAEMLEETLRMSGEDALRLEKEGKLPDGHGVVFGTNARGLGELGIGLNPNARISGNMLEDEKVYGTCHIAIGSNYDQDAPSLTHLDCLVREPTIWVEYNNGKNTTLLEEGLSPEMGI